MLKFMRQATEYTRSSATAERQRFSYTRLSRLTHWSCTSLSTASVLQLHNRLAKLVSTLPANKPCDIRTLSWIGHSSLFKVIQGHPYWCRQESRMVCCRNVQLMPTLFLKLTKIRQRENGKFIDFNDLTQVWKRPSKKRVRISTNDLYCQKLELLAYIFVADSMGLHYSH